MLRDVGIEDFGISSGYGQYCVFTDTSLVGKPVQKGQFKFIAPGVAQLTDDVLIVVTMVGDDPGGELASEMLKTVASIKIANVK